MFTWLKNKWRDKPTVQNAASSWGGLPLEAFLNEGDLSGAGVAVTADSAKRSAAVYACVQLIGGIVGSLPCHIYQRGENGERTQVDHDYWWLLNETPSPGMVSQSFWEFIVSSFLLRGDGVALIDRTPIGAIKSITPIPAEYVRYKKTPSGLVYLINDGIKKYGRDSSDILHFPNFGFDGEKSESVIARAARQAVGTALQADSFSGEWFKNGASPSIIASYANPINKDQIQLIQQQITEKHTGQGNRHKPLIMGQGPTITTVSMSPEDSQLLETRRFQVAEIARAFGVPPHMIGEATSSAWGSGLEQISAGFYRYTIGPHVRRIAQEINKKFWPRSEKFFAAFDHDELVQGDLKTQAEYYAKALGGPGTQGWMTPNEVRRKKNLPPTEGGDKLIISGATIQPNADQGATA